MRASVPPSNITDPELYPLPEERTLTPLTLLASILISGVPV